MGSNGIGKKGMRCWLRPSSSLESDRPGDFNAPGLFVFDFPVTQERGGLHAKGQSRGFFRFEYHPPKFFLLCGAVGSFLRVGAGKKYVVRVMAHW